MWCSISRKYQLSTSHPFEFEWMCYYVLICILLIGDLSLEICTMIKKTHRKQNKYFFRDAHISGNENMQAMDFNIGKFKFLKHLILVSLGLVFLSNVTM